MMLEFSLSFWILVILHSLFQKIDCDRFPLSFSDYDRMWPCIVQLRQTFRCPEFHSFPERVLNLQLLPELSAQLFLLPLVLLVGLEGEQHRQRTPQHVRHPLHHGHGGGAVEVSQAWKWKIFDSVIVVAIILLLISLRMHHDLICKTKDLQLRSWGFEHPCVPCGYWMVYYVHWKKTIDTKNIFKTSFRIHFPLIDLSLVIRLDGKTKRMVNLLISN